MQSCDLHFLLLTGFGIWRPLFRPVHHDNLTKHISCSFRRKATVCERPRKTLERVRPALSSPLEHVPSTVLLMMQIKTGSAKIETSPMSLLATVCSDCPICVGISHTPLTVSLSITARISVDIQGVESFARTV